MSADRDSEIGNILRFLSMLVGAIILMVFISLGFIAFSKIIWNW